MVVEAVAVEEDGGGKKVLFNMLLRQHTVCRVAHEHPLLAASLCVDVLVAAAESLPVNKNEALSVGIPIKWHDLLRLVDRRRAALPSANALALSLNARLVWASSKSSCTCGVHSAASLASMLLHVRPPRMSSPSLDWYIASSRPSSTRRLAVAVQEDWTDRGRRSAARNVSPESKSLKAAGVFNTSLVLHASLHPEEMGLLSCGLVASPSAARCRLHYNRPRRPAIAFALSLLRSTCDFTLALRRPRSVSDSMFAYLGVTLRCDQRMRSRLQPLPAKRILGHNSANSWDCGPLISTCTP